MSRYLSEEVGLLLRQSSGEELFWFPKGVHRFNLNQHFLQQFNFTGFFSDSNAFGADSIKGTEASCTAHWKHIHIKRLWRHWPCRKTNSRWADIATPGKCPAHQCKPWVNWARRTGLFSDSSWDKESSRSYGNGLLNKHQITALRLFWLLVLHNHLSRELSFSFSK